MLTKMIEANPKDVTDEHLKQIMPGLIKVFYGSENLVLYILYLLKTHFSNQGFNRTDCVNHSRPTSSMFLTMTTLYVSGLEKISNDGI